MLQYLGRFLGPMFLLAVIVIVVAMYFLTDLGLVVCLIQGIVTGIRERILARKEKKCP